MKKAFSILLFITVFFFAASPVFAIFLPNDPCFKEQWGLYNYGQVVGEQNNITLKAWTDGVDINVVDAWDILYNRGKNAINSISSKKPIVIAVIDTGVNYNQEDLKDKILRDKNGDIIGYDFVDNDTNPMDTHGHGTMIASIAAASSNNKKGMAGVIWDAKIMPIRILDKSGHGETEKILEAIKFAADHGADVINMSIISNVFDPSITSAVEYAYNKGAVLVAASGNSAINLTNTPLSPINNEGSVNMVIGVGAVNSADGKFPLSNYGKGVDISAPGTNLVVADIEDSKLNEYSMVSGTSAAAALVSGGAALIKNYHRDWSNKKIIDAILQNTSAFKNPLNGMGAGRLNITKALDIQMYQNNKVLKLANRSTVYVTIAEQGMPADAVSAISSPNVFYRLGYDWDEIIEVSDLELGLYKKKLPLFDDWIPAPGSIVKKPDDNTLYLTKENSIKAFATWQSYISRGYDLSDIQVIPSTVVDAYKKGNIIN